MEQNAKRIGLMNWIVLLGGAIGMSLVSRFVSSSAGVMATVLTVFGLLVALLSYFHMGLFEREQFEKMEVEELSKARGSQSLLPPPRPIPFRPSAPGNSLNGLSCRLSPPCSFWPRVRRLLAVAKAHRHARPGG